MPRRSDQDEEVRGPEARLGPVKHLPKFKDKTRTRLDEFFKWFLRESSNPGMTKSSEEFGLCEGNLFVSGAAGTQELEPSPAASRSAY